MKDFSRIASGNTRNRNRSKQRRFTGEVFNAGGPQNQQNQQNPQGQGQNSQTWDVSSSQLVRGSLANTIGHAASVAATTGTLSRKTAHRIIDDAFRYPTEE